MVSGLFIFIIILYIPKQPILNSPKLKQSAGDNLKFVEKSSKFSKRVENTVGKGEQFYEQFLLFPQCFQRACFPGASKGVIVWEWVKLRFFLSASAFNSGKCKFLLLFSTEFKPFPNDEF